jgi:hypothetical protein
MKIKFEPRDFWIGVFWDIREDQLDTENITRIGRYPYVLYPKTLYIYVCVVPMFPICFEIPLYKTETVALKAQE